MGSSDPERHRDGMPPRWVRVPREYTSAEGVALVAPLAGVDPEQVHGFLVIVQTRTGRIQSGSNLDGTEADITLAETFIRSALGGT